MITDDRIVIEDPALCQLHHAEALRHESLHLLGQFDALLEGNARERLAHIKLLPVTVENSGDPSRRISYPW